MNEPLNVIRRVRQEQVTAAPVCHLLSLCARAAALPAALSPWPCVRSGLFISSKNRKKRDSHLLASPCHAALHVSVLTRGRADRAHSLQAITDRLIGIKEQSHAMRACEWANSKLVTDVGNRHLAETKKIAAELEQENREMMLLRKSRMREFLKAEAEVFEQQVRARHTHTSCLSRGPARSASPAAAGPAC